MCVSSRGYYYDLSVSPHIYEFKGNEFRFPSEKKMEMFVNNCQKVYGKVEVTLFKLSKLTHTQFELSDEMKLNIMTKVYNEMRVNF